MPPAEPVAPSGEFSVALFVAMGVLATIATLMALVHYVSNYRMSELAERTKHAFSGNQTLSTAMQTPPSDDEQQSESPSNTLL